MDSVNGLVTRIEDRAKALKSNLTQAEQELKLRESEIIELKQVLKEKDNELAKIKKDQESLKMAVAMGTAEGSNEDARRKINELVREIDRCVAMLNA